MRVANRVELLVALVVLLTFSGCARAAPTPAPVPGPAPVPVPSSLANVSAHCVMPPGHVKRGHLDLRRELSVRTKHPEPSYNSPIAFIPLVHLSRNDRTAYDDCTNVLSWRRDVPLFSI